MTNSKSLILIILFACITLSTLYLYRFFLVDALIAGLICIATFGLKERLYNILRSNLLATLSIEIFLMLFFVLPLVFLIQQSIMFFSALKTQDILYYFQSSREGIKEILSNFPMITTHIQTLLQNLSAQKIAELSLSVSSYIGSESLHFFMDLGFILLFLFLFFYHGRSIYLGILRALPLNIKQGHHIFEEVSSVLKIVLLTSLVNMILQGLAFGIFLSFFHYKHALILGICYGIASLVPVVGGALVWIPVAGFEIFLGHFQHAIIISLYALIFIAFVIDNVIKPIIITFFNHKLLSKPLKINELIIFFAIFAGFSTFGFWGILLGPAITAFFIALWRLYQRRFKI
ncbi:acid membrane antigen A [Helicobacter mustelae]|uniref:AI-2E family transporter n=1 Tax=Helicobacter mustelae TaxID=217 RepID=UPI000E03128D|nr:AI-2E family transporter [Helicobacter mustelae]STP12024.1 acid membrane antigen A [Helicobacter mustelae]